MLLMASGAQQECQVMAMVPPHPNVLALIGCVTSGLPKMLLCPVCELGSALSYVQDRAKGPPVQQLQTLDKVVMAHDIVKGMAHLIASHFVHRDLAARNVLVDSMRVCKVADFGLSRAVAVSADADADDEEEEQYYRSAKGQSKDLLFICF